MSSLRNPSISVEKQSSSIRAQLRKWSLGLFLMSSSICGCCPTGCNPPSTSHNSTSQPTESNETLTRRYLSSDAGPDAGRETSTTVPPPPTGATHATPTVDAGVDATIVDAGADAGIVAIPANQGTPEYRAELAVCYNVLPNHICAYDASTTDAAGHVTDVSHVAQFSETYARENLLRPYDTDIYNDLACDLADSRGNPTWVIRFQHDGAVYTCDYHNRAGVDLRFHHMVPCTRHPITASTRFPCPLPRP